MRTPTRSILARRRVWLAALLAAVSLAVAHGNAAAQSQRAYTQPELDQMLAPIALYPDPLLSQILMASTYPIEVVEAARWSRANPGVQGDTAVRAVEGMDWDPSVKSLVAFPDVLARMDENLEWTRQLGDAFLVQEPQVMETIQRLRQQARAAGTLTSDAHVYVVQEGPLIVVQPVDPGVVYVPYYDPRFAYGTWWWPSYPPVFWAPWPRYAVHYPRPGFFWGPAVRVSVGFFFGAIDWPHREVRVVSVNNYYYRPAVRRDVHVTQLNVAPGPWRHDPWHRRGVTYRAPEVQQRFAPAAPPREIHRTPERWPEVVPPRPEPRAPIARPVPVPQSDRVAPRQEQRPEARRNAQPQERRANQPQPGNETRHTPTPQSVLRTETRLPPKASDAQRQELSRDQRRVDTAAPRPSTPSPSTSAAPSAREARRADVQDTVGQQEKRTDARAPAAHQQPQRGASQERAQRGQHQPPDSQVERQPRPRGDNRN